MKFLLPKSFSDLTIPQTVLLFSGIVLVLIIVFFLLNNHKKSSASNSKDSAKLLAYGALCISLSFVLSYIKLFSLPGGGSVTLLSMLPVMLYAHWFGFKRGFIVCLAYGLLQYLQSPFFLNFIQFACDYLLGFGALALAGLFRKNFTLGIVAGTLGRFFFSWVSGFVFFGSYAPVGQSAIVYSFLYQLSTIGVDGLLCVIISIFPIFKRAISRIQSKELSSKSTK